MRLLNTSTYKLEEYFGVPPRYAILSHTWGEEEVLFSDVQSDTPIQKKGYDKILKCCQIALSEQYSYVWIDTCCIDKSSSAELSEAINSMFTYYSNAAVCYVYLDIDVAGSKPSLEELRGARWMYRGWTLQELIAPSDIRIYTKSWRCIGTRRDHAQSLATITHIDVRILLRHDGLPLDLSGRSIAQRMSWASQRSTTRAEDLAYCLFGLFDVRLPPLYGEGAIKAFRRLQEDIIMRSTDMSILAWSPSPEDVFLDFHPIIKANFPTSDYREKLKSILTNVPRRVIANSPRWFAGCGSIAKMKADVEPFRMTNKGLRMKIKVLQPDEGEHGNKSCTAVLSNSHDLSDRGQPIGIRLVFNVESGWMRSSVPVYSIGQEELRRAQVKKIYLDAHV